MCQLLMGFIWNLEFDDYEATTMMGGLVWTF